jgi:hypothetical protein
MVDIRINIIITVILLLTIYAIFKEYNEHDDCFLTHGPRESESIYRSIQKLEKCVKYDIHTIKWRRNVICSVISVSLIFIFIHARIPTAKEVFLCFLFIFIVFNLSCDNYIERTSKKAINFSTEHIHNIKDSLNKHHKFILPSSFI